jgi:predicted XRE-type DNA-binding protein
MSNSWLEKLYQKRVRQNRSLSILITDDANQRGTGKSTLAIKLGERFDRTDEDLSPEKAMLSADKFRAAYSDLPKGSSIILDEAEAELSKYRASSDTNKAIRDVISQGRILEKYIVFTAPASGVIDTDLKSLFDVWILVKRRGKALVHECDYNPYGQHPLFRKQESIEWSDIESERLQRVYEELSEAKEQRLDGHGQGHDEEEYRSALREQVETQVRNDLIRDIYGYDKMSQKEIAEAVGLSRSRVADIVAE